MSVQLILFDLDGTTVDSKEDLAVAVNRTLTDLNLPTRPHPELYSFVGNGVRMLLVRAVGEDQPERLEEALARFHEHYLGHLTDHSTLYPGVLDVMRACADRHQVIVTNKALVYTEGIVENLGLNEHVDLVLTSDMVGKLKPDPAMLNRALEHYGVQPHEALMVGDGLPDLGAAQAAGIPCALLTCGLGDPTVLRDAKPDHLLSHIHEILPLVGAVLGDNPTSSPG